MNLNYFDVVLLIILLLFLLRGAMNGFMSEVSGMIGLFGGLWYARHAYRDVSPYLGFVRSPVWRDLAAYGVVFLTVIVAVALAAHLLSKCLSLKTMPPLDKTLGALSGLARGMAICSASLVVLRHFLPDVDFFRESLITPNLRPFMDFARMCLPASLG